jgi:hypothetical protein
VIVLDRRFDANASADDVRGALPVRVFFGGRELETPPS